MKTSALPWPGATSAIKPLPPPILADADRLIYVDDRFYHPHHPLARLRKNGMHRLLHHLVRDHRLRLHRGQPVDRSPPLSSPCQSIPSLAVFTTHSTIFR